MQEPKTLLEAIQYFADPENCHQFMISIRWPDGIVRCPRCGKEGAAYMEKSRLYFCKGGHDKPKFSLRVGTIFEDSAIGLEKWLPAAWLIANCKNGISSYEVARALGVTQKSAWHMLHRLREAMRDERTHKLGSDGSAVESDEAYVGPLPRKMHADRRNKAHAAGRYSNKSTIHGLLDRELRQVRAQVVPNAKKETLQNLILENVAPSAKLYTDQLVAYFGLDEKFLHEVVDHSREYVRGQVHTNGLENFWSCLKRTLRGSYICVEAFHMDSYVDEQVFRYNNRATKDNPLTDLDRFTLLVSQGVGRKLTYAQLTGKEAVRAE